MVTISATICSVAGPTPLVAARLPSSIAVAEIAGKPPTARAAVRKARIRNGFSPLSSRNAAICSSTWATAFLSMKLRTASVIGGGRELARERAGTPAQLEQLLGADQREQARRLPAREHRREERGPVGSLEPLRPRPGRLDGAEAFPVGRGARRCRAPRSSPLAGWTKQPSIGSAASSSMTRAHTWRSRSWA